MGDERGIWHMVDLYWEMDLGWWADNVWVQHPKHEQWLESIDPRRVESIALAAADLVAPY